MNRDFDQLVDVAGLAPEEEGRVRRMHDMLVAAGPPPELTAALVRPPVPAGGDRAIGLPLLRGRLAGRRPRATALVLAAALGAACFGGGYVIADRQHGSAISASRVVELEGSPNSLASLRVGTTDENGNLPIQLTVDGLPKLKSPRGYYILMLVDGKGEPSTACGYFRVDDGTTSVRFSVPYKITGTTRWVVTAVWPGLDWPGHVVMTTS